MKKTIFAGAAIAVLSAIMIMPAWGQDFQKNYPLLQGGTISIANVSGDILVTAAGVATVTVAAYREGRDKELIQIEDQSTTGHISLKAKYPQGGGNYEASVRFEIQVPRGIKYLYDKLSTASGDIKVNGAAGELGVSTASGDLTIDQIEGNVSANTASGEIKINGVHGSVLANTASGDVSAQGISGTASATTASGDVNVELIQVEGTGEMKFSSASGDVIVKAPSQLDAQVDMSTSSGSIKSDFPITIEDMDGHGKKASGRFGSGLLKLKIATASGDLKLLRY
jgi:hypothetical protein